MEFALAPEVLALQEASLRFAERELAPFVRESEAEQRWPDSAFAILTGFLTDATAVASTVVLEAIATGDAGGLPAADSQGFAAGAVAACPDEVDAFSCWLLVGEQPRLPWGPRLQQLFVIDGDELSLFEVETTDEVAALAFHASNGVSATLGRALGRWPVSGLFVRGRARLWTSAVALGVAQAAFDATVAYAAERVVFGKPVAHHQGNAFELAVAATNIHAARLAVRDAAARFDEDDEHSGYWATQAWFTTMDTALHVTDLGIQLLGGHGFLVDHLAEKRFREVGMLRLLAGGRDAALLDLEAHELDTPDPVFA